MLSVFGLTIWLGTAGLRAPVDSFLDSASLFLSPLSSFFISLEELTPLDFDRIYGSNKALDAPLFLSCSFLSGEVSLLPRSFNSFPALTVSCKYRALFTSPICLFPSHGLFYGD